MKPIRYATWLSSIYLLIAGGYILVSGRIAAAIARDVAELERIEHLKGIAFVVVTAAMLWGVSLVMFSRLKRSEEEHVTERRALMLVQSKAYAAELAAAVAHDFNNLLLVLRAGVEEMVDASNALPNPVTLTEMRQALESASDLTKRMARAARGERGVKRDPHVLGDLIEGAVKLMRRLPRLRGLSIEVVVHSRTQALLDPLLVEQIIVNLLLNAADAGEGDGRIRVEVDSDEHQVLLAVHDDGKGLAELELREGLQPFTTTKKGGLGLGLLSVRASAEASQGRLAVSRSPLGGASFTVTWPKLPS